VNQASAAGASSRSVDAGKLIGMSLIGEHEIERASAFVAELGFEAMEVFHGQIGPALVRVKLVEAHATWTGDVVRSAGLQVSTLNCAGHPAFDPHRGADSVRSSIEALAEQLRWAAAMGSPRVLIWDGIADDPDVRDKAAGTLAHVIDGAFAESGLADPPEVSVELHPFTFALRHDRLDELAAALAPLRAGICLDFCHFAVALGPMFVDKLSANLLAAVNHIHYSDSDGTTSELHFPPGLGVLDFDRLDERLRGRGLSAAWDLFCWPGPERAVRTSMSRYAEFVRNQVTFGQSRKDR
jgi:sugar phosphate isomerase/epimerase